jgi:pyrophosphate--fructose-6-phosphate 1-phosphotransferase
MRSRRAFQLLTAFTSVSFSFCQKTIDGDLRNEFIEMSFGFDTACKVYSEQVAALCADAVSARKTYHFCRLMGRTASHITLEVALQTHPNIALIGEEIQAKRQTLSSITKSIADVICTRALQGKHYGCVILPEGLVDFLPDVAALIAELNELMAASKGLGLPSNLQAHLSTSAYHLFSSLPAAISQQLLLDRDPHGNVQVSKIESERLVAGLVEGELSKRKKLGTFKGSPSFVCHFLGYEGRCGLPSNFDANYCYALGQTCGALLATGQTGMIATIQKLIQPAEDWQCGGLPLTALMNLERRAGHDKPVIRKALVNLSDTPFQAFETLREGWKYQDSYRNPGAIQYDGPHADLINMTLEMEQRQTSTRKATSEFEALRSKL